MSLTELSDTLDPRWMDIRLGQIHKLLLLGEIEKISSAAKQAGDSESTFARELDRLQENSGFPPLTQRDYTGRFLTPFGKVMAERLRPIIDIYFRAAAEAQGEPHMLRIAAGGSLITWLIGSQIEDLRSKLKSPDERPAVVDAQPMRNRLIARHVECGALDAGLVRHTVLEDDRLDVESFHLGTIQYFLYVPAQLCKNIEVTKGGSLHPRAEREILQQYPMATVGPEGEFRYNLNRNFENAGIKARIEFSYAAFPNVLPHLEAGKYIAVLPDIRALGGAEPPNYRKFLLSHLCNYQRHIKLIVPREKRKRSSLVDVEELIKILSFPK